MAVAVAFKNKAAKFMLRYAAEDSRYPAWDVSFMAPAEGD